MCRITEKTMLRDSTSFRSSKDGCRTVLFLPFLSAMQIRCDKTIYGNYYSGPATIWFLVYTKWHFVRFRFCYESKKGTVQPLEGGVSRIPRRNREQNIVGNENMTKTLWTEKLAAERLLQRQPWATASILRKSAYLKILTLNVFRDSNTYTANRARFPGNVLASFEQLLLDE